MRLLTSDNGKISLKEFPPNKIPPYAILSHTWGEEEVTFEDLSKGGAENKIGYEKIRFCGRQASQDGYGYFWVDTCCIDKSSSAELTESINSMFTWYRNAGVCYVYLADVSSTTGAPSWETAFRRSKWFTRGWTLQELLAPGSVEFFSREGVPLGSKKSLEQSLCAITRVPQEALRANQDLSEFTVDERMGWMRGRETTREEDMAYSLLGIFHVHMPLIYGEGKENALMRLEDTAKGKRSEKEEKCHQLFRLTSGDRDVTYEWYKDRVEARIEGTCQWFLSHENFRLWLEQESGPLLVSADPGCGKSVLAKYLIDHRLRPATICYFFFKDQDQNTVRQALCAMLHQLFSQKPFLIKHAMSEYARNGPDLINATASLWKILDSAVRDSQAGTVVVVLDALDECDEREFEDMVQHVKDQFRRNQSTNCKLKFLITSRPYEQILSEFRDLLEDFPRVHIPGEEESKAIGMEVNLVIQDRAQKLGLSDRLRDHLTEELLAISHRTYLWVYLVFDHLKRGGFKKTKKGVESAIKTLPKSVNDAYDQILNKSTNRQGARKALSIILAAQRPLTVSEMNIAVNIQDHDESFQDLDLEEDQDFQSSLRSWCGLFISIHHGNVYFLHQTAREFLLADPSSTTVSSRLHWHGSITNHCAHTILAEQCVLYLNLFNSIESADDSGSDALLNYSARYWGLHFHEANIADNAPIIPPTMKIIRDGLQIGQAFL